MTNINITEDSLAQVLGHPLFQGMPQAVAVILLRDTARLHAQDGEILFREGGEALEYVYVCQGSVDVFRHTADGIERVFHRFQSGQLLAESAMFMSHGRYPMCARAQGDIVVQCLKRTGLLDACRAWPELSMRMMARLSDRVYQRINELEWFSDSTAAQRLADYLLRQPADGHGVVQLPLTQRQLASQLGVRAETLSRLLSEWVQAGYLEGARRRWRILERGFLESLVQPARRAF